MTATGPGAIPYAFSTVNQATPGISGAGTVICTMSVPPNAYATVFGGYFSGAGTAGLGDADNMAIQSDPSVAGTFVTAQVLLMPPTLNLAITLFHLPIYALSTIRIIAVGNAAASVVYHASIATSYPGPSGSLI